MRSTPSIEITRHYQPLTVKETEELVGTVADLLVTFLKDRGEEHHSPVPVGQGKEEGEPEDINPEGRLCDRT